MELAIIAEAEIVNTGVGAVKQAKTDELRWGVDHWSHNPIDWKLISFHAKTRPRVIERTISINPSSGYAGGWRVLEPLDSPGCRAFALLGRMPLRGRLVAQVPGWLLGKKRRREA